MNILDVLSMTNPSVTSKELYKGLMNMSEGEYRETYTRMLAQARKFIESDDGDFSARLDSGDAAIYASFCGKLSEAFDLLQAYKGMAKGVRASLLSEVMTWCQFLSQARGLVEVMLTSRT